MVAIKIFWRAFFLKKLVAGVGVYSGLESKKVCETYPKKFIYFSHFACL